MESLCKVVIVDDEMLVRQGIKHLLNWEKEGFCIVGEAANGQEAMELIKQVQPHIVITDIVMPIIDGVELTSRIKQQYPQIEVIVLSSFSEFHYVRDTFQKGVADYLLKPKLEAQQLLSILNRTTKKIASLQTSTSESAGEAGYISTTLDRLMSGFELEEQVVDAGAIFPYSSFRLFGADLKQSPASHISKDQIIVRIKETLEPFMNTLHYEILPTDPQYVVFLLNSSEQYWESMKPAIRALSSSMRLKEKNVVWIFDNSFSTIQSLHDSYQNSFLKLAAYRYFLPSSKSLIIEEELPKLSAPPASFNMNLYMEQLQKRKFELANEQLNAYMEAAAIDYRLDSFAFKAQLGNIIFNLLIVINKLEYQVKDLDAGKYQYIKKINESRHVGEAIQEMKSFIERLNGVIAENRHMSVNPNISLIMDYIDEHYMEAISLSDIANYFHFNASYLSTFFSSHNDEGFSEYLNRIRVEKAAELLAMTDSAISDISVQVGYSDHSYFTKVFKKLKGYSPSQYRKLNHNRKKENGG